MLLRQDVRGRVCTPAARREALLDEFERSALSGPKFAALVGVKYQTFAWWRFERRRKREASGKLANAVAGRPTASPLRLVEVVAGSDAKERNDPCAAGAGVLQVHLAGGVRLEIGDAAQAKLAVVLIKALEEARSSC